MKRNFLSVALLLLSALVLCGGRVANVMAAADKVVFQCQDFGSSSVVFYDHSSGAPAQTSGAACAAQLATLLHAGFTNVNVTVQTYTGAYGAPGGSPGVNGTYSTYIVTNPTGSSGNPSATDVIFMCADYGTSAVVFYDHSSGAPAQTSGASCAAQLASLLRAGFTNVNQTVKTWSTTQGAPNGGVDGTYTTYLVTNPTGSSGSPGAADVIFQCEDFGSSSVVFYDHSSSAPGQTSGATCAAQLASLLQAGFTSVNQSVQTWSAVQGAPGGVTGTYSTYVVTNPTGTSGNASAADVIFQCGEYGSSSVVFYDHSSAAPAHTSGASCASQLASLLSAGFTSVNQALQTWSTVQGAPGGVTGTYSTYVVTNPTGTSGNPSAADVTFMCGDYGASPVVFYDHSSGAPGQTSGAACAAQLVSLLSGGLTNVNVTAQAWTTDQGAPGGVAGTYSTYLVWNNGGSSGGGGGGGGANLKWLPVVIELVLQN